MSTATVRAGSTSPVPRLSLAGAEEKLRQLDRGHGQHTVVDLGIPTTRGDR
jgi:hypothetical protein